MEPVDLNDRSPTRTPRTPLLNCLLREARAAGPASPRTGSRRPSGASTGCAAAGGCCACAAAAGPRAPRCARRTRWHPLSHTELVKLVAEELRPLHRPVQLRTARRDDRQPRRGRRPARRPCRGRRPPEDPYLRSEQSLITGHPLHPAPKARGGGPVASWLPYAPEAYARFPLVFLGVREDAIVEEGDQPPASTPSPTPSRARPRRLPAAARPPLAARPGGRGPRCGRLRRRAAATAGRDRRPTPGPRRRSARCTCPNRRPTSS